MAGRLGRPDPLHEHRAHRGSCSIPVLKMRGRSQTPALPECIRDGRSGHRRSWPSGLRRNGNPPLIGPTSQGGQHEVQPVGR